MLKKEIFHRENEDMNKIECIENIFDKLKTI
jgi:hypothetical protein